MGDKDAQDKVVLGIHSRVGPDPGNSAARFMDGHAWLSLTANGKTEYYGLWPDGHPLVEDNGSKSDIRTGLEEKIRPTASRYYELSPQQLQKFQVELKENVTWTPTTTCAGWASDTVKDVTGHRIDATEFLLIQTPRELIDEIQKLEKAQPTNQHAPAVPAGHSSSSLGAADDHHLGLPLQFLPLHEQSLAAVQRLESSMARSHDAASDRLAYSATRLAADSGLSRIDHVVLGEHRDPAPATGNVFVVQGALHDPAHRRVHMLLQDAIDAPVERTLAQLQSLASSGPQNQPELALAYDPQQVPRMQMV
ncbi:MAG: hypothetical protein EON59_04470 [Alphaproteobacteria bacterium]|nr:MAG: hypothetical protein EON59_04470 [Alphaproteobacteria bacterium]